MKHIFLVRKFRNNMAPRKQSFQLKNISPVTMLIRCRQINASTVWHQESKVFSWEGSAESLCCSISDKCMHQQSERSETIGRDESNFVRWEISEPATMLFNYRQINAPTVRRFRNNMAQRKKFAFKKYQPSHYVFPLQTNKCTNCQKFQKQYSTTKAKFSNISPVTVVFNYRQKMHQQSESSERIWHLESKVFTWEISA